MLLKIYFTLIDRKIHFIICYLNMKKVLILSAVAMPGIFYLYRSKVILPKSS